MNEVQTPLREVRLRVAFCFAVAFLAIDAINPIKVVCGILNINPIIFAIFSLIYLFSVTYGNWVEVLGRQHVPEHGPVIFTGNHMNQFVDAAVMLVTAPLQVGFLVAAVSFKKAIIGTLARAAGGIPVSRPQDMAKKGVGQVMIQGLKLLGQEGTTFTALQKGDKLRPGRSPNAFRVKNVVSDTEAELAEDSGEPSPKDEVQDTWLSYDILGAVDQGKMFESVQNALAHGKCLGIFPEGGSHDRTDLLPLKVGVAAIAFGVLDKYDRNVPIIPVGLNYFRGHRFRGRVVVQFGEPVSITQDTIAVYKTSKRAGYQKLLAQVEEGMRSVIVTAPDYGELKLVHTTRRLFQKTPSAMQPSNPTKYRQEMARRFAVAFQLIKDKYNGEAKLPADLLAIKERIIDYQDTLDNWGLYDYQVNQLQLDVPFNTLLYTFVHALLVITLAAIPSIFLNAPVGLAASWYASTQAKKDLEASRVKLYGRDVLMSKKILFSLVAVPALWITYAVLLSVFTNLEKRTIFVLFLCFPIFAYIGVTGLGAGMVDMKDLRPAFLRLMPGFRSVVKQLPKQRIQLQKDVRSMVRKYGPELGSVYSDPSDVWEKKIDLSSAAAGGRDASKSTGDEEGNDKTEVDPDDKTNDDVYEKGATDEQMSSATGKDRMASPSDFDSGLADSCAHFTTSLSCALPREGEVPRVDSNQDIVDDSTADSDPNVDANIDVESKKDN